VYIVNSVVDLYVLYPFISSNNKNLSYQWWFVFHLKIRRAVRGERRYCCVVGRSVERVEYEA
jgi:hypothetical protein